MIRNEWSWGLSWIFVHQKMQVFVSIFVILEGLHLILSEQCSSVVSWKSCLVAFGSERPPTIGRRRIWELQNWQIWSNFGEILLDYFFAWIGVLWYHGTIQEWKNLSILMNTNTVTCYISASFNIQLISDTFVSHPSFQTFPLEGSQNS